MPLACSVRPGPFSKTSNRAPFLADFITKTCGFRFSVNTGETPAQRQCELLCGAPSIPELTHDFLLTRQTLRTVVTCGAVRVVPSIAPLFGGRASGASSSTTNGSVALSQYLATTLANSPSTAPSW